MRGGSAGIYIKDCIAYKMRNDIISLDNFLEHLWIELKDITLFDRSYLPT